jgi:periplasmic divalent cation tolerance protein
MTDIASVYAVFANDGEARRIARAVVEERLAACANILGPCHSIYRWQGAVEETGEIAAVFKTSADRASALVARVAEMHSYDVPCVVVWPVVEALDDYAAWVRGETSR